MVRLVGIAVLLLLPGLARAQAPSPSPEGPPAVLRAWMLPPGAPTQTPAFQAFPASFSGELSPLPLPRDLKGETVVPGGTLEGRRDDPWLAFDKAQHLAFSFLWTLGSQYALVNKASLSEGSALPVSVGVSATVGLAKEYYDWRIGPRRFFSRRDLAADAVGILLATGFILL